MSEPGEVPVIDLEAVRGGSPEAVREAAAAIHRAFSEVGLVYIRNHGVSRDAVLDLYERFRDLLNRPESEKASWGGEAIWYQRGWTPPNTEQAVVAGGQPDFKECFFAAPHELDARCVQFWPQIYAPNVWPANCGDFAERYLKMGRQVHAVGLTLLELCEVALGLDAKALTGVTDGGAHVTRLLKYLALQPDQVGTGILWGEEHTDFNLLTLLPGGAFYSPDGKAEGRPDGDGGGLTLRTRPTPAHPNGVQVAGKPPPGCMVAQVGQQLEVLTGGRFLATPHRISAPDEAGWTRCSMAHFVHCHGMTPIAPLAPFAGADEAYAPPVLAGTYAIKTLVDIGLAPHGALSDLGYRHYDRLADWRSSE